VYHLKVFGPPSFQQLPIRLNRRANLRNIVAEHFSEASWLQEIALHIDDKQRAASWLEFISMGFCINTDNRTCFIAKR
jgi:hypothetical protein